MKNDPFLDISVCVCVQMCAYGVGGGFDIDQLASHSFRPLEACTLTPAGKCPEILMYLLHVPIRIDLTVSLNAYMMCMWHVICF